MREFNENDIFIYFFSNKNSLFRTIFVRPSSCPTEYVCSNIRMTSVILHTKSHGNNVILDFTWRIYQNTDWIIGAQREKENIFVRHNKFCIGYFCSSKFHPTGFVGRPYLWSAASVTRSWPWPANFFGEIIIIKKKTHHSVCRHGHTIKISIDYKYEV